MYMWLVSFIVRIICVRVSVAYITPKPGFVIHPWFSSHSKIVPNFFFLYDFHVFQVTYSFFHLQLIIFFTLATTSKTELNR